MPPHFLKVWQMVIILLNQWLATRSVQMNISLSPFLFLIFSFLSGRLSWQTQPADQGFFVIID